MVPSRFRQALARIGATKRVKGAARRLELGECAAQVVEDMAIAVFVLDREGRVAVWNDACARLTGLEAAKVIGGKDHWKGFYAAARARSTSRRSGASPARASRVAAE